MPALLEEIQQNLLARARQFREEHTTEAATWEEFTARWKAGPGFVIAAWCGSADCEAAHQGRDAGHAPQHPARVAARSTATCVKCGTAADVKAWFAKAY